MRTLKQLWRGAGKEPVLNDQKMALSISEVVQKHAKEYQKPESRVVRIYRMGKGRQRQLLFDVDIQWVFDNRANIETALKDMIGSGGRFELQFCNDRGREAVCFPYDLAGPNRTLKEAWFGDDDSKPKPLKDESFQTLVAGKLLDDRLAERTTPDQQMKNYVEFAKVLKGNGNEDGGFQKELMSVLINNAFTEKEVGFDNALKILELSRSMQPSVEKDDPMTALISSFAPILGQIIAARSGAGPQLSADQLQTAQSQLAQLQEHLPQLGQGVPTPKPGEPPPEQAPPVAQEEAPGAKEKSALDVMVEEFRHGVDQTAPAAHLAYDFYAMVERAQIMAARGAPHVLFAGLINQVDPVRLSNEFDRFVAAIPEFRTKPETATAIKDILTAQLIGAAQPEAGQQPAEPGAGTVRQENEAIHAKGAGQAPEPDQSGADNEEVTHQPNGNPTGRQPSENDNEAALV